MHRPKTQSLDDTNDDDEPVQAKRDTPELDQYDELEPQQPNRNTPPK